MEAMGSPEWQEKCTQGPVLFMTVFPNGIMTMGKALGQWFVYAIVVSGMCAYVAGRTLGPGAEYLAVFRLVGTVGFASYALAHLQASIWYKRSWMTTARNTFDGLV